MQSQPLSQTELFAHTVTDIADAIAGRPGETKDQRAIRSRVGTHLILGLTPGSATELMLAGHSVMFHTLMTDSIRITLQGEIDTLRRGTRAGVIAMNHAFHRNLDKLEQYQSDRSEARNTEAPEAPEAAQTEEAQDTTNQKPVPVSRRPTPTAKAPADTLTQPFAPPIPAQCPLPPEPIAFDFDAGAFGDDKRSAPTIAPTAAPAATSAAASSANENGAPAASQPGPPQLNRAQKRLLRRGQQHAR
jgi:hypothetical protein